MAADLPSTSREILLAGTPRALQELFEGRHFGAVVVELPPR
ncbi:hypothetical protein [Streptomyces sp. NPDC056683]